MKRKNWHALGLTLLGLLSCGGLEFALPTGVIASPAVPVSGNRAVRVSGAAMMVGRGGTLQTAHSHTGTRRRARYYRRRTHVAVARTPKSGSPIARKDTANTITGVAVVPDDTSVRITLEGTQAFTPDISAINNAAGPATMIRVPGVLADARGVGAVSVLKNGVGNVRYANQANGMIHVVADSQVALAADPVSSPDKKHWEIVLRRPGAAPTQVAMAASSVLAPADTKPAPVKPVTVSLPGSKTTSVTAPKVTPPAQFIPAKSVALNTAKPTVPLTPLIAGTPQAGAMALPGTGEDKRVSLDVVAADINDVLKALALQSGINIVTSTDVKGNITVSLKRVPMIEALDTITRLSGYRYARLNSGYIVGSPASVAALIAAGRDVPMVTGYIRYRYVSAADLYSALNARFAGLQLPQLGNGDANPALPKLLVLTDTAERIAQVRGFVEALDKEVADPTMTRATEIYKIKAAAPADLIRLVTQLVPSVVVQIGPAQAFQAASTGQSASFTASGSFGPSTTPSGGAGAAVGGPGNSTAGAGLSGPNSLVLTGTAADVARAKEVLERIDIRTTQIAYEARVVDVSLNDVRQLGLRYDFSRQVFVGERNETGQGTLGPSAASQPASNPNFGAILRSPYTIGATLDALETNGRARTLSSPNLSALDGQPATAFIGDQVKYLIAVQQTQQGQTIQTETATVGITLKVTGKASSDGYVTLYIHPEVSTITSFVNIAGTGISLPQISTRFVDTTIRVKSGETIAIGGLLQEQDINNLQKVPIIGDIPVLGQLFRRSEKRKIRSEIVVFITARASE